MISVDEEFCTKMHGAEHFKDHTNREEFFFHGMVILLGFSQFFEQ